MFYLILAIMLVLFYIFAAPTHIKGTINVVVAVFLLVALFIALLLGFLQVLQFSSEIWLTVVMLFIALWAMWDIHFLDKQKINSTTTKTDKYPPRFRRS